MLKMQFIQKMALISVRRLIRVGLLLFFKTMLLYKNLPCASTTQLTKPSWSALKIWRHLVCFLISVEMSIFCSLGWTCKRLGAQWQEGCRAVTVPCTPIPTIVHKPNSPRAGTRHSFHPPTPLPTGTSPCSHSVTWHCWESARCGGSSPTASHHGQLVELELEPGSWPSFSAPNSECSCFGSQRQGLGLRREQQGGCTSPLLLLGWPHVFWHLHFEMILYIP